MERRIFGLENEYGVTCTFGGSVASPRMRSPATSSGGSSTGDARPTCSWRTAPALYLDVGSHPSTRPRSATQITDVVVHDKAGERILEALLAAAEVRLHEEDLRPGLSVQEQHRLGGKLLRMSRELPGGPPGRVRADGGCAHPVLRHAADLLRRREGPARTARSPILHLAARRAHLGGRLERDDALETDHQYEGRAARGRRAVPAPPRDRGRFQHERVDHVHEGRHHRSGAADGGVQQRDARPHPREPDPGDPRDLPRRPVARR